MKRYTSLLVLFFLVLLAQAQDFEMKSALIADSPIGFLGMAQDRYGYIWLADNGEGLYKYDGKNTVVYRSEPANPNSLSSGRIENVFIDRDGMIWLPYFDSGLDRFDSETEIFTHFRHEDQEAASMCSNGARDVVEDLNGDIWVGTIAGLDKFDKKTGKFIHDFSDDPDAEILRKEHVRKLYVDSSGIIWIGTGSAFFGEETEGGLFSLDPNTGDVNLYRHSDSENSLTDNRVRAIFEDSRGVFWVGTAGDGLHTMNREEGTFTRHLFDPQNREKLSRNAVVNNFAFGVDHITFIDEDDEGGIWIGTFENGINHYNPKTGMTNHYGVNEPGVYKTDNFSYWDMLKTNDGTLWFTPFFRSNGTSALYKINITPNRLKFYESDGVYVVAQGMDNTTYLGANEGVQVLRNGVPIYLFKTYDTQSKLPQRIRDIKIDADGNIWATTAGAGLFHYDILKKELKNYRHETGNVNSLFDDDSGTILIKESGEIFIGTINGVDIFTPENHVFKHFEINDSISGLTVNRFPKYITIDKQKRIWVAGDGGIYKLDREKSAFKKYELGLGYESVNSLYEDVAGDIWISTTNHGLRRYDNEHDAFQSMLDATGYLNKYTTLSYFTQDKNKAVWLGMFNGLLKYDIETNQGTLFGNEWVPEIGRAWNANCIYTLNSGEIILGFDTGYYRFQPDKFIRKKSSIQKPFIEKLFIGNKALNVTDNEKQYTSFRENNALELSHDQNNLSFEIGYIDYLNNQASQSVSYKLENYDLGWRNAPSGYLASYSQLRPGAYELLIKAQDSFGNWGEKRLSIFIAAPWYLRWWAYSLYALVFIGGVIFVDRYQRKRLLKKATEQAKEKELEQAKKIKKAYDQLEVAHTELKTTQSQLIQSEKMASLGELTAGIAHEIQNPLNFVNNFSEVNAELIEELKAERSKAKAERDESLEDELLDDLSQNTEKIHHHGKRASGIVKGMLEHSRTDDGKKELTDINALADEYLRLAYHGLRAKDKSFNADFKIDLDSSLPKINVIPQDIGRVLLNLINNAFYAVDKKAKSGMENYKPEVIVYTKLSPSGRGKGEEKVMISVKDNGDGIPENIKDKIFQPFFTTKPTGSGTGLGLSLSYDIVKAHGGELNVESPPAGEEYKEKEGCFFSIELPINKTIK